MGREHVPMDRLIYTGVGSRKTPLEIQMLMSRFAACLSKMDWTLRSGGAEGADKAFAAGAVKREIYRPEHCTPEALEMARKFHPKWHLLSTYAQALHGRNAMQVLGPGLDSPSRFLMCWTPDGCTSHAARSINTGGTGTAISIADAHGIRIWNLAVPVHYEKTRRWLDELSRKSAVSK